jgi:hypothetical protein
MPPSIQALFASSFYGFTTPAQKLALARTELSSDLREFMRRYHVDAVVVLPLGHDPQAIVRSVNAAIGVPSVSGGATIWYDVQHRLGMS